MKKQRGFTLIELLAVIVVLAVIALISTPVIINVIDKAKKGAFEDSAYGVLDAGKIYFASKLADTNAFSGKTFDFTGNIDDLRLSGQAPAGGKLSIKNDGKIGVAVFDKDKKWCAKKDYEEEIVTVSDYAEETCKIIETASDLILDKNKDGNTDGLFTDDYGNTRYGEAEVKNYVTFSNELWRIIGVFDGRIKLIKDTGFGPMAFDTSTNIHRNGSSNWATSTLNSYLNTTYYATLTEMAKDMIAESVYKLGGSDTLTIMLKEMYERERGTSVVAGSPLEWTGKIGLPYVSDFGYASGMGCPSTMNVFSPCNKKNWMKPASGGLWSITPYTKNLHTLFYPNAEGRVGVSESTSSTTSGCAAYCSSINKVFPSIYLKDTVKIVSGDGTISSPYILA